MTQETRKERRVKIVSLNVRYRSATLEEFIENHAHDVSRGGIFIKATNPFPPGTLLKFEIRLANDQAVIAGVGRVVWKRDVGAAVGDMPSGMGVKFIKLDEPSKAVIDRLVSTKTDAGASFETQPETTPGSPADPPPAPANQILRGGRPPPAPPHGRAMAVAARKPTMIGVGATVGAPGHSSVPPRPGSRSGAPPASPPRPLSEHPAPMFPKSPGGQDWATVAEPTLMKQAAELLEEALREAGGSLAEVGSNPLFGSHGASLADAEPRASSVAEPAPQAAPADAPHRAVAPAAVEAAKLEPAAGAEPERAPVAQRPVPPAPRTPKAIDATVRIPRTKKSAPTQAEQAPSRRTRAVGATVGVAVAAVAVVVGVSMYRRHHAIGFVTAVATAHPTVAVAAPPPPKVEPVPSTPAVAAVAPSASSVPSAVSAAPSVPTADASAAPHVAKVPKAPTLRPVAKAPVAENPAAETPPAETPTAAISAVAAPAAAPSGVAPSAGTPPVAETTAPSAGSKPPAASGATPSATADSDQGTAPAPKRKPPAAPKKPGKPSDDNPY